MNAKEYVANIRGQAAESAANAGWSAISTAASLTKYNQALNEAKAKADVNREINGLKSKADEFVNSLQYDRDYEKYGQKVDEFYSDFEEQLMENELLSKEAVRMLRDDYLPILKQDTLSKANVLGTNTRMAEIEIEVEGYGSTLASNPDLNLQAAVEGYKAHVLDLGIFNVETIDKMATDFKYSAAPIKAVQTLQDEYKLNFADGSFNLTARQDEVAREMGLDGNQKASMIKKLNEFTTKYDAFMDEQYKAQCDKLDASIAEAMDIGQMYDLNSIDLLIEQTPPKYKIMLYKSKTTARKNNDQLVEQSVRQFSDDFVEPTEQIWDLVNTIYDPDKRDEMGSSLLVSYGESLITEDMSLSEVRKTLQGYEESSLTGKARNKAIADITKSYLDRENDVTKVAKEMLANTEERFDTIARTPQDAMLEAVENFKPEALQIDAAQLEKRGEEYIEEYIDEVARAIAPKISIGLGLPRIEMDPFPSEREQTTAVETPPEVVKEVARLIVEEQVDKIAHPLTTEEDQKAADNIVDTTPMEEKPTDEEKQAEEVPRLEPESEPESTPALTWEEPWWYAQYAAKRTERTEEIEEERAAYQARIEAQAESVRKEAGVKKITMETSFYTRPQLEKGMTQDELVTNMLQIIRDGEGRYISQDELSLIRNDDIREQMIEMASTKDSFLVDSPLALSFVDSLRRDVNLSGESLRRTVEGFVNSGLIKAETAESGRLTQKYNFAVNPNETNLAEYLKKIPSEVFPTKKGEVYNSDRDRLHAVLNEAANDAIAMNPNLLGKDFPKLQDQLQRFATEDLAKKALGDLKAVTTYLSSGDATTRIRNLENSSVSTFMQDVQNGQYDVLLDYDMLQQDDIRILRNSKREVIQDALTKKMTPYRDYAQLTSEGTRFDQLRVMANASFLLAGGALEKSLQGSFGIKPKDMKIMGKNWAFADPMVNNLYFIATDTDVNKRGTLGWGMATADSDGVHNLAMFKDYVDPQLVYEIESLGAKINDPLFKKQHEEFLNPTPKGGGLYKDVPRDASWRDIYGSQAGTSGGMWADAPQGASHPDSYKKDTYQEKIDLYEEKTTELKQLTDDIMQYRYSLMGLSGTALRKRL